MSCLLILKENVFNFLDDLVVFSPSVEVHVAHVREVLGRPGGWIYFEP